MLRQFRKLKNCARLSKKLLPLARRAENLTGDETKTQGGSSCAGKPQDFFTLETRLSNCEQSRFRGKKGEPKEPIERTAGVKAVQRLFGELGARYKDRNGGYTRIIKLGRGKATTRKWQLSN